MYPLKKNNIQYRSKEGNNEIAGKLEDVHFISAHTSFFTQVVFKYLLIVKWSQFRLKNYIFIDTAVN